jgi:hypothetical protein
VVIDMKKSNWANEGMRQSGLLRVVLCLLVLLCFSASLAKAEECDLSTKWFQVYSSPDQRGSVSANTICKRFFELQRRLGVELGGSSKYGKCAKLSIRQEEGKEQFIITVDSNGEKKDQEKLAGILESKAIVETKYLENFKISKTSEELGCFEGSETTVSQDFSSKESSTFNVAIGPEENTKEISLEANYIRTIYPSEIILDQFQVQYDAYFKTRSTSEQDESDANFAFNVIIEVQRKIGAVDDGIWGSGSKRALVRWFETNPSVFGEEGRGEALNLLNRTDQKVITKANLAKLSETFANAAELTAPDKGLAASKLEGPSKPEGANEQTDFSAEAATTQVTNNDPKTTEDPADLNARIEELQLELEQKKQEIKSLNARLEKRQTGYEKLENDYYDLLEKPILSSLDVQGSFKGIPKKIDKSKIKIDQNCWNPNQSLNDNLEDISKENCLEYDDGSYEAVPDDHTFVAEKKAITISLQPSFAKTISSIILEVGEQFPAKELPWCQVLVEISASTGSTFKVTLYPKPNGFLEISRKDFEAASDAPTEWQTAKLLLRNVEGDQSSCALVNPSNDIIIQKEPGQNSALIDRDGTVKISASVAPIKLQAKPLTVILSKNTGYKIGDVSKKLPDPNYAFSNSPNLQLSYFTAFANALEKFLEDENSNFGEISIYISTETSFKRIYFSGDKNNDVTSSILDEVKNSTIYERHPDITDFLKRDLKDNYLGSVVTFGSQGTPQGQQCFPSKPGWTNLLKDDDKYIELNIMPTENLEGDNTENWPRTSLYQCKKNVSQYILLQKNKYEDADGIKSMEKFLVKLLHKLSEE